MSKKSAEDFKQELIDRMMSGESDGPKVIKVSSPEELVSMIERIKNAMQSPDEASAIPPITAQMLKQMRDECQRYTDCRWKNPFKPGDLVTQREGHGNRVGYPAIVIDVLSNPEPIFHTSEAINSSGFGPRADTRVLTIIGDSVAMFWTESFELRSLTAEEIAVDGGDDAA